MRNLFCLAAGLMFFIAICFIPARAGAENPVVVAKIGEKKITLEDLNRILSYYPEDKRRFIRQSPKNLTTLLRRTVQGMVLSDLARKEGVDKDPQIRERLGMMINDLLAVEYLKRKVLSEVEVTDSDIREYYKAHIDSFTAPERIRARHILIKVSKDASQAEKKAARKKAEEILEKIKKGEDFTSLAEKYSDDPGSAKKGGDLGFFPRGRMVKPFEEAAFSLKPGEVSNIVETRFGYHIIKVEEKRSKGTKPLSEVRDSIRKRVFEDLRKAKIREIIDKAMKDAGAEVYPEKLLTKKPLSK